MSALQQFIRDERKAISRGPDVGSMDVMSVGIEAQGNREIGETIGKGVQDTEG